MITVKQFINTQFGSNTFLLSNVSSTSYWLIDAGNIKDILSILPENGSIKGAFITHGHHDHIHELELLISRFPACVIYISEEAAPYLNSPRLNLSVYHQENVIITTNSIVVMDDLDCVPLFDKYEVMAVKTPGHNPGCLTYLISDYIFTGDSLIPGKKTITKLRGGNKIENSLSQKRILSLLTKSSIICPGHGDMLLIRNVTNLSNLVDEN